MTKATTNIKEKDTKELAKLLVEKREELRKLRFEAAGARPKNTTLAAKARKEIARILTELSTRTKVQA